MVSEFTIELLTSSIFTKLSCHNVAIEGTHARN